MFCNQRTAMITRPTPIAQLRIVSQPVKLPSSQRLVLERKLSTARSAL
jgi:hypothetical protein